MIGYLLDTEAICGYMYILSKYIENSLAKKSPSMARTLYVMREALNNKMDHIWSRALDS